MLSLGSILYTVKQNEWIRTCLDAQKSFSDSFPLITTARCKAASSGSSSRIFFRNRNIIAAASFTGSPVGTGATGGSAEVVTGGLGGGGPSSSMDDAGEGAA